MMQITVRHQTWCTRGGCSHIPKDTCHYTHMFAEFSKTDMTRMPMIGAVEKSAFEPNIAQVLCHIT